MGWVIHHRDMCQHDAVAMLWLSYFWTEPSSKRRMRSSGEYTSQVKLARVKVSRNLEIHVYLSYRQQQTDNALVGSKH